MCVCVCVCVYRLNWIFVGQTGSPSFYLPLSFLPPRRSPFSFSLSLSLSLLLGLSLALSLSLPPPTSLLGCKDGTTGDRTWRKIETRKTIVIWFSLPLIFSFQASNKSIKYKFLTIAFHHSIALTKLNDFSHTNLLSFAIWCQNKLLFLRFSVYFYGDLPSYKIWCGSTSPRSLFLSGSWRQNYLNFTDIMEHHCAQWT